MSSADIANYKQQIIEAARFIMDSGVMSLSNHGNFSARVPGTDSVTTVHEVGCGVPDLSLRARTGHGETLYVAGYMGCGSVY